MVVSVASGWMFVRTDVWKKPCDKNVSQFAASEPFQECFKSNTWGGGKWKWKQGPIPFPRTVASCSVFACEAVKVSRSAGSLAAHATARLTQPAALSFYGTRITKWPPICRCTVARPDHEAGSPRSSSAACLSTLRHNTPWTCQTATPRAWRTVRETHRWSRRCPWWWGRRWPACCWRPGWRRQSACGGSSWTRGRWTAASWWRNGSGSWQSTMTFQFVLFWFFLDHAYSHTSDLTGEVNVWSGSCDTLFPLWFRQRLASNKRLHVCWPRVWRLAANWSVSSHTGECVCVWKGKKKAPGAAKLEVACSSHKWVKGRGDQVKPKAPFSSRATWRKVTRGGACGTHSKRHKGD